MEIFYEDILETFLFCFIASMGIMQIMVARRGWHGLSIYGGRARRDINYTLGIVLLLLAYAWYFSDPLHRNVRNIEAFMSLVCLILGIIAAAAVTALLASLSEALRRRYGRGAKTAKRGAGRTLERITMSGGTVLRSQQWGKTGENLVVLAEQGNVNMPVLSGLFAVMPNERGLLSLHPDPPQSGGPPGAVEEPQAGIMAFLRLAEEELGVSLGGETFLGLGWAGDDLLHLQSELESFYHPRGLLAVAPVVPDCERGFVGDTLLSNTPLDIGASLMRQKPWRESGLERILRIWLPIFAVCVVLATAVTVVFDVRWKFLSGPAVGMVLSLWLTYFFVVRRGGTDPRGAESKTASRLCDLTLMKGGSPLTVVVTYGDSASLDTLPVDFISTEENAHLEFWEDVLRGKFLLDDGTMPRLTALIWEGREEGAEDQALRGTRILPRTEGEGGDGR